LRVLGIDFGGVRIGVALGESEAGIASPRKAIKASGTLRKDAVTIQQIYIKEQAQVIALGIPLSGNGEVSKMANVCNQLSNELGKLGLPVKLIDESLTSLSAQETLRQNNWTAATIRSHIDSEAACKIIERYFESQ
jgi:putative holliday junction resolvase